MHKDFLLATFIFKTGQMANFFDQNSQILKNIWPQIDQNWPRPLNWPTFKFKNGQKEEDLHYTSPLQISRQPPIVEVAEPVTSASDQRYPEYPEQDQSTHSALLKQIHGLFQISVSVERSAVRDCLILKLRKYRPGIRRFGHVILVSNITFSRFQRSSRLSVVNLNAS